MDCKKCGQFFQPSPEEEKLLTTGGLPVLCPACEKLRWEAKKAPEDLAPVYPGVQYKGDGRELYRAARFDANGVELLFVALPPKPYKALAAPLRRPRKHDVHVFIMSERRSQLTTIPRTRIITNLTTFKEQKKPLKVIKIPDYWDPFTGVGAIEVKQEDIVEIERVERQTNIKLTDGGQVVLYYR
jgi:hypothetical protein